MANMNVKFLSLHHIDKENDKVTKKNVSLEDASSYITELTEKMLSNTHMREYKIKSDPNPIAFQILNIISSLSTAASEGAATVTSISTNTRKNPEFSICERLLSSQKAAQERYKILTNIKKGSLIQGLVDNDSSLIYVIALIEHSSFIDENDLKKKMGLPDASKATLKAARIHFNEDLSVDKIFLSDSSKKISEYWYDGFLDLVESINNISNTNRAYGFIKNNLKTKLSTKYKQDYLEYSNSLNVYFSHNNSFNFNECLDFIFASEPNSSELDSEQLKNEIKKKKTPNIPFDNIFDVDITDIKPSLSNTRYKLNSNVELKLKTPPTKIKENIYAYKLNDGQVGLAITNVDKKILEQFNFFNIEL